MATTSKWLTTSLIVTSLCACTAGADERPAAPEHPVVDTDDAGISADDESYDFEPKPTRGDSDGHELTTAPSSVFERAMDGLRFPLDAADPLAQLSDEDRQIGEDALGFDKAVLGSDSRVAVTTPSVAPYSSVAQLVITFKRADGTMRKVRCTGTLVRADAVLTAAHCLYSTSDGWAYAVRVLPGMTATAKPFGESSGRKLFVPSEYRDAAQTKRGQFDYGIVRTWARLGDRTGTRKFAVHSSPTRQSARIVGYAGDIPNTMLQASGATASQSGSQVLHTVDAYGGTSGAAVVGSSGSWSNTIFAIHSGQASVGGYNVGVLVTTSIFARLTQWAEQVL